MKVFDLALADNMDLLVKNGDFQVIESTQQHILLLFATTQGHWRASPLAGIRYVDSLHSPNSQQLKKRVRQQLELDGMTVGRISLSADTAQIEANY